MLKAYEINTRNTKTILKLGFQINLKGFTAEERHLLYSLFGDLPKDIPTVIQVEFGSERKSTKIKQFSA